MATTSPLHRLSLLLACILWSACLGAQDASSGDTSAEAPSRPAQSAPPPEENSVADILQKEEEAEELIRERSESTPRPLEAGTTPMESMLGLIEALEKRDYARAGGFLDMRYLPEEMDQYTAEELIGHLRHAFSVQNILDVGSLSDAPEGHLNDGLPSYRDQFGTIVVSTGEIPLYLQRVPGGELGKVWKISNATVQQIPLMWEELGYKPAAQWLKDRLPEFHFMGMENWQVVATALFFLLAWPLAVIATWLMNKLVQLIPTIFPRGIERFFRREMRFFTFILIARLLVDELSLSLKARIFLESSGTDYLAYTVLVMGVISLVRDYQIRKRQAQGRIHVAAVVRPLATIIKVLVAIIAALIWAEGAGYNMSTILAGLGVGSLAVALAAQKTLENLIGAITLYAAKPVAPGDFCRFGTVVGTVEEIGLRSTVIRTLNRTLVHIPNSVFSSMDVENYSARDRIRYFRNIGLLADSADQLRVVLVKLRELFHAHPALVPDTYSVRLELVEDASARLRLDAGIDTTDYQEFLAVAEDLNLRIIEIVQGCGARFCSASQATVLREDRPGSDTQQQESVELLQQWRAQDRLPFPNHSAEDIAALSGTVDYPPRGSSSRT